MGSASEKTNKFFAYTESVGEMIILNFWTLLCCVPVVTIGASMAAMHDVLIRKKRNEFYTITGSFFRAFKNNFRHATVTWLIFVGVFLFLWWDYELLNQAADRIPGFIEIIVLALMLISVAAVQWSFVLVARYRISIPQTIGYAFTRIIAFPFRTLLMLAVTLVPLYLLVYYPLTTPLVLLLGLALVARVQSGIYDRALHVMEDD
ncbi:MAG: DUF624 domain-containing protein [Ruminococcaceae bacterium]|nr:DUF624 domain-containing protein [Oscillospiraceae bacterium]